MTNLPQEGISPEEIFGDAISVYTDEVALEDGTLADLTQFMEVRFHGRRINRMTGHLFEQFRPLLDDEEGDAKKFGLRLKWIFRTKMTFAQESFGNAGVVGDVVTIPPILWLVLNETGGWTTMYPEDY